MRQIKFRAWDKDMREMVFVSGIQFDPHSPKEKPNIIDQHNDIRDLDEVELIQFTGLLDKNGKEIYEGDIIENEFGKKIVKWADGGFYCDEEKTIMRIYMWMLTFDKITIIGNVFENPELINN